MSKTLLTTAMELLSIESYSGAEQPVVDYLLPKLKKLGFETRQDEVGNIYAVRGEGPYPLLNAHMDSVKGYTWVGGGGRYSNYNYLTPKDDDTLMYPLVNGKITTYKTLSVNWKDESEWLSCMSCKKLQTCARAGKFASAEAEAYETPIYADGTFEENLAITLCFLDCEKHEPSYMLERWLKANAKTGEEEEKKEETFKVSFNEKTRQIVGSGQRPIGGDDKCGIAIALEVARLTDIPLKLLFTVQEEVGLVGATYAVETNPDWFDDVAYNITIDRKGGTDLCVTTGGQRMGSNYFIGELMKWGWISGIEVTNGRGTSSDNRKIQSLVTNAVNISAGYHSPHSCNEYVKIDEMVAITKWVRNFLAKGEVDKNELTKRNHHQRNLAKVLR